MLKYATLLTLARRPAGDLSRCLSALLGDFDLLELPLLLGDLVELRRRSAFVAEFVLVDWVPPPPPLDFIVLTSEFAGAIVDCADNSGECC